MLQRPPSDLHTYNNSDFIVSGDEPSPSLLNGSVPFPMVERPPEVDGVRNNVNNTPSRRRGARRTRARAPKAAKNVSRPLTAYRINRQRLRQRNRKAPHYTHLKCPLGLTGALDSASKCVTFGTVTDKDLKTNFHAVSLTSYNSKNEKCLSGLRLFLPQWEELMLYRAAITNSLEVTAMGGDLEFSLKLGSGIRLSINEITGELVFQHHRGEGRNAPKSDINVTLDREEWAVLIKNRNILGEKIQLHSNDHVAPPINHQYNEHLHRASA